MKKPSSNFLMIGVLSSLLAATCWSVFAAGEVDLEEVIQEKISERHPTDTPAWWRSLGPDAPKTIMSLYDKTTGIYQRLRLVEALGWFNDPATVTFLKKQAESTQESVIRNGAVRAVGNSAGNSEIEFLGKFLDHEDPQTRTVAGQALRKISDPRATALLEKFYQKETMPWVKDRVQETPRGAPISRGPLLRLDSKSLPSLKAEFAGNWKGVLIFPSLREPNLLQVEAHAKTKLDGSDGLKGEITLQLPASAGAATGTKPGATSVRSVSLQISQATGKDTRLSGWLKGDVLKEWGAKEGSIHFEGDLQENGEIRIMRLESREILLAIIFRRG